jgi:hypothetical protein
MSISLHGVTHDGDRNRQIDLQVLLSKDASFFTHYYSHNVYSVKIKLNLEAKNALEK